MFVVLLLSLWGDSISTPFVVICKIPDRLCGGRPNHHDKECYGLSGCHREGLVFLVRPKFLLNMGSAQGGQTQTR